MTWARNADEDFLILHHRHHGGFREGWWLVSGVTRGWSWILGPEVLGKISNLCISRQNLCWIYLMGKEIWSALFSLRVPSLYSVSLSPPGFRVSSLVFIFTIFYILHVSLGSLILTYSDQVTHHLNVATLRIYF